MKTFFTRKRTVWFSILIGIPLMLYLFRVPLFREMGNFLIRADEPQKAEVLFLLGGSSFDRGNEAARILKEGYAERIVCLGANVPTVFLALDIYPYTESEVARINLLRNGIDSTAIELLAKATSTKEEAEEIVKYCLEKKIMKAIVLSGKFHTRRVGNVFRPAFEENGIELIVIGAPSTLYSEEEWWKSEEGMIALNNEYMKLFYYFVKY